MTRSLSQPRHATSHVFGSLLAFTLLLLPSRAKAEWSPTFHDRDPSYWITHGGITLTSLAVAGLSSRFVAYGDQPMPPSLIDASQRGWQSNTASGLSSGLYTFGLLAPLPAWGNKGTIRHFFHASFVYGETLSVSWLASTLFSHIQRPRPFTYDHRHPSRTPNCRQLPESACQSFYSARASAAFASAFSGGYIFSELSRGSRGNAASATAWGVQLGLATLTAALQVKAGEAFLSDALLGAVVGTTIGGGMYAIHSHTLAMSKWDGRGALIGLGTGGLISVITLVAPTAKSPFGSHLRLMPLDVPAIGASIGGTL